MPSDRDLRAAVGALADEWDREGERDMTAGWASDRLRAILAEHPATPAEDRRSDYLLDGSSEAVAIVREARGLPPAEPDAGGEGLTEARNAITAFVCNVSNLPEPLRVPALGLNMAPLVDGLACIVADRERVLRDRIVVREQEHARHRELWAGWLADAASRAEAAEALAAERGERLAAVEQEAESLEGLAQPGITPDANMRSAFALAARGVRAALGPEAADLLADRERRAEARGAERALREAAGSEFFDGSRRWIRDRADQIAGEGQ